MTNINFMKPVVDIEATGNNIKSLRIKNGFSVHEIQNIFGFEYPQAVYSWEQGRNIPFRVCADNDCSAYCNMFQFTAPVILL